MTSLNDIREDPTGFVIQPEDDEGTWMWQRISDKSEKRGFASRDEAIDDAENTPVRVEEE